MPDHSYDTPTKDRPATGSAGATDFPSIQAGRYKLICVIGSGGAGTVYRALDTTLDKEVAIKKLHSASDEHAIRFQREAKLAGALKHENVMSVRDFGVTDKNEPYLILDYVRGESLSSFIERAGRLPVEEALRVSIQIAKGLHHAHSNGVIHRDIKPSNVILVEETESNAVTKNDSLTTEENRATRGRIAKIVDFGLAKSVHDEQNLTQIGSTMGTPKYMSPEQARGVEVDERSDIYSLGCLIFEVLAGSAPFRGATAVNTIEMHLNDEPPTLESKGLQASDNLEKIVATCLKKDPAERYQTPKRLADVLSNELEEMDQARRLREAMLGGVPQVEHKPPAVVARVRRMLTIGAYVIAAAALALGVVQYLGPEDDPGADQKPHKKHKKQNKVDHGDDILQNEMTTIEGSTQRISSDIYSPPGSWTTNHANDEDMSKFLTSNVVLKDKIRAFDLSEADLTSKGFDLLAQKVKLEKLTYSLKPLNDETLDNVARLTTIDNLRLGGTTTVIGSSLSKLSRLPKLRALYIGEVPLTEDAFKGISKIESVQVLELTACKGLTPSGMKHLLKLKNLEQLKLDGTDVTNQGLESLLRHPRLSYLSLKRTSISDPMVERLKELHSLKAVDLKDNKNVTEAVAHRLEKSKPWPVKVGFGPDRVDETNN